MVNPQNRLTLDADGSNATRSASHIAVLYHPFAKS